MGIHPTAMKDRTSLMLTNMLVNVLCSALVMSQNSQPSNVKAHSCPHHGVVQKRGGGGRFNESPSDISVGLSTAK